MSIEFSGTVAQRIDFGSGTNIYGTPQKTIIIRTYLHSVAKQIAPAAIFWGGLIDEAPFTDERWTVTMGDTNNGDIAFGEGFDGTDGAWRTNAILAINTLYTIIITYDNTNVANDPLIYLDNVSQAINEDVTPIGTAEVGTNGQLRIGASGPAITKPIDGILHGFRVINRIITANERATITNSRDINAVFGGTVFAPNLDGAAGLSVFDDVALAAANTLIDPLSGAAGTPAGNPVARGNTITNLGIGVQ